MCLNCPETIPPPQSVEKLSSTKSISCTKKVGDHWWRGPSEKDKGHSWQLPNCPVRHGGGERLLSVKETLCHLHLVHPQGWWMWMPLPGTETRGQTSCQFPHRSG